jgi:hypothetical protein
MARYKRIIHYTSGSDSVFHDGSERLSEALDREIRFAISSGALKTRDLESIILEKEVKK